MCVNYAGFKGMRLKIPRIGIGQDTRETRNVWVAFWIR